MSLRGSRAPLEMWGGVECTVNRTGDTFLDQLEWSGHARRPEDLELVAGLGIRTLRYPVLWERTAPSGIESARWAWPDERLARLRELGIRPIVGLLHHGSGPRYTSLLDPAFPEKLARFARAVAERYPWVDRYTPVNEPLTTARFSGLYGHWYPHGRDARTFARAFLNQCRAVALAMRAIREVNPSAQLVQTEDLGKTYSTEALAYQAEFENERRWVTFDVLCGRVRRGHPMWDYFRWVGLPETELDAALAEPCPPALIGVNYYVTGERFLDERLEAYPPSSHGGNGRHAYADVEAVRVCAGGIAGPRGLLRETWARYGLPIAVSEAHLGCTREEQLRWLAGVWRAAQALRADGVDVRAVTAWSLLGAYDWASLLTRCEGCYEPGVFDVRGPRPRPTALATMVRDLAVLGSHDHPVLSTPGWWERDERLLYPPTSAGPSRRRGAGRAAAAATAPRPLAIIGATGTLGRAFARRAAARGLAHRLCSRQDVELSDGASVAALLDELRPWAVVNAAGYVRVDDAEGDRAACYRDNADGAGTLAAACAGRGVAMLTFSSDLVFDGRRDSPYVESDAVRALGVYGMSKAEAERRVRATMPAALIVRTSAFFGPWDDHNFVTCALRSIAEGVPFRAADDLTVSPTYVPDLVDTALDLLIDGESGVWHLANEGATTWADLARRAAELAGLDPSLVDARPVRSLKLAAPRPAYSVLGSERGTLLPSLEDALGRYIDSRARDEGGVASRPAPRQGRASRDDARPVGFAVAGG